MVQWRRGNRFQLSAERSYVGNAESDKSAGTPPNVWWWRTSDCGLKAARGEFADGYVAVAAYRLRRQQRGPRATQVDSGQALQTAQVG